MADLTLDRASRTEGIRAEIIRLKEARALYCHYHRFNQYAGTAADVARAFYRRISDKFRKTDTDELPDDPSAPDNPAERKAVDWSVVTQRGPMPPDMQDAFFAALPSPRALAQCEGLCAPFTEAEVQRAVTGCPKGKASGPDGLPNDWYAENADALVPLLTGLYNKWFAAGAVPASFRGASICCIPKTASPRSGLDFRPIALLNTDYKIYSRLLLERVRQQVPRLVSPMQFGFVPGRQVHDAIDVFTALQQLVRDGRAPSESFAVLLDFAKAYDTLDRRFLSLALQRLQFPAVFVAAVNDMHLATTATYISDGFQSADHAVLNGIRQGCPFAPVLFILAVDLLYVVLDSDDEIKGIPLPSGRMINVAGYADDTTVYLDGAASTTALHTCLRRFEEVSGLAVNVQKSQSVALDINGWAACVGNIGFPRARQFQLCQLLGAHIASSASTTAIWTTALSQLRSRLYLAEVKTTDVLQRVQVAQAIIVPKIQSTAKSAASFLMRTRRPGRARHDFLEQNHVSAHQLQLLGHVSSPQPLLRLARPAKLLRFAPFSPRSAAAPSKRARGRAAVCAATISTTRFSWRAYETNKLLYMSKISGDATLIKHDGAAATVADFPGLVRADATIGDIVAVTWHAVDVVSWTCRTQAFPLSPRAAHSFRLLCDLIAANYPAVLLPHGAPEVLRVTSADEAGRWWLHAAAGTDIHLRHARSPTNVIDLGPVRSMADIVARVRDTLTDSRATVSAHGWLTPLLQVWCPAQALLAAGRKVRGFVQAAAHDRADIIVAERADRLTAADGTMGHALNSLSWKTIGKLRATSSHQRLFVRKLKGGNFSGWDRLHNRHGCPHCQDHPAGGAIAHMFWAFPAAQSLWQVLIHAWTQLGGSSTAFNLELLPAAAFALRLPQFPARLWRLPSLAAIPPAEGDRVHAIEAVARVAWQHQVICVLSTLWKWRHHFEGDELLWTTPMAENYLRAALRATTLSITGQLLATAEPRDPRRQLLHALAAVYSNGEDDVLADAPTIGTAVDARRALPS